MANIYNEPGSTAVKITLKNNVYSYLNTNIGIAKICLITDQKKFGYSDLLGNLKKCLTDASGSSVTPENCVFIADSEGSASHSTTFVYNDNKLGVNIATPQNKAHFHEPSTGNCLIQITNTMSGSSDANDGMTLGVVGADNVIRTTYNVPIKIQTEDNASPGTFVDLATFQDYGSGSRHTILNTDLTVNVIPAKSTAASVFLTHEENTIKTRTAAQVRADIGAAPSAHTHPWSEISDKPSVFAPAAHTHAIADVTSLQTALDGKLDKNHVSNNVYNYRSVFTIRFTGVTHSITGTLKINLPSSWNNVRYRFEMRGYAYSNNFNHYGSWRYVGSGFAYSPDSRWYLQGGHFLEGNPYFNQVRYTHDGSRCCILLGNTTTTWTDYTTFPVIIDIDVITDGPISRDGWSFEVLTSEDGYAWGNIQSTTPSTYAPAAHGLVSSTHTVSDLTTGHVLKALSATTYGFGAIAWSEIAGKPSTFTPSAHSHAWSEISDKPSVFAPAAHTHAIADVTSLQTTLDGKQPLDTDLTAIAGLTHSNRHVMVSNGSSWTRRALEEADLPSLSISKITGLQSVLDGKASLDHTHTSLRVPDTRDVATTTSDYNRALKVNFKTNSTIGVPGGGTYSTVLGVFGWNDATGGHAHELAFSSSGIYNRIGPPGSSWGNWKRLLTTEDISTTVAPASHTHPWSGITDKPSTFTPAAHGLVSSAHTVSDLTTGHVMKALSATSFGFAALTPSEIGAPAIGTERSLSITTAGWVTIATCATGRAYGEFHVYDPTSSRHNFTKIIASTSYGVNNVSVIGGNCFSTRTIAHVRILYNTSDRTYGGAKLQVYCENAPFTLFVKQFLSQEFTGWKAWNDATPVAEGTPSGWAQDDSTYIPNITDAGLALGGDHISCRYVTPIDGTLSIKGDLFIWNKLKMIDRGGAAWDVIDRETAGSGIGAMLKNITRLNDIYVSNSGFSTNGDIGISGNRVVMSRRNVGGAATINITTDPQIIDLNDYPGVSRFYITTNMTGGVDVYLKNAIPGDEIFLKIVSADPYPSEYDIALGWNIDPGDGTWMRYATKRYFHLICEGTATADGITANTWWIAGEHGLYNP